MTVGEELTARFDRMVRRDGGAVTLVAEDAGSITVSYRPGAAGPDCADGVCVLPGAELAQLMTEALRDRAPGTRLVVEQAR